MTDIIKYDMTDIWASSGDVVAPDSAKIIAGWGVEVVPRQWWNWFENRQDQNIAYMLQKGFPEWDATTEYQINKSYVQHNGTVYKATATSVNSNPTTLVNWVKVFADYSVASNALGALIPASGKVPYFTSGTAASSFQTTSYGRSLVNVADASAARAYINAQALSTSLTALSSVTPATNLLPYYTGTTTAAGTPLTAFGRSLLDDADPAAARLTLVLSNVDNTSDANKPISTAQQSALNLKAPLDSPAFIGSPTAPTQAIGDDSAKIATTAWYQNQANDLLSNILMDGEASVGTSSRWARSNHRHPTDTSRLAASGGVASNLVVTDNIKLPPASALSTLGLTTLDELGTLNITVDVRITTADALGAGAPIATGGVCVHKAYSSTNSVQAYYTVTGGTSRCWSRCFSTSVWTPWEEYASTDYVIANSSANPAGTILAYAGTSIPTGYLVANGATLNRDTYSGLFSAIGTTYGPGNGSTTFEIPDLRGEFLRGLDNGRGVDTSRTLGSFQAGQMQAHIHTFTGTAYAGHTHTGTTSTDAHSHTFSDTTSSAGAHTHDTNDNLLVSTAGGVGLGAGTVRYYNGNFAVTASSAGAHTHTVSGSTSSDTHSHTFTTANGGGFTPAGTIASAGGTTNLSENRPRNIAVQFLIKF